MKTDGVVALSAINVNLKPCDSARMPGWTCPHTHCAAKPIHTPCPIPPSVTLTVRRVECDRRCLERRDWHEDTCPAHPITVVCSLRGARWDTSEIGEVKVHHAAGQETSPAELLRIAHERWGFLRSLLLGHSMTDCPEQIQNLRPRRDAMFAALADEARAEDAAFRAQGRALSELGDPLPPEPFHRELPEDRPSARMLERYVRQLVSQVGAFS